MKSNTRGKKHQGTGNKIKRKTKTNDDANSMVVANVNSNQSSYRTSRKRTVEDQIRSE